MKTFDKKDCYFAHSVGGLSEHIKTGVMGILKDIFNSNYDAVSCAFGDGTSTWGLCLPADKVIEVEEPKKWRPFTLEEFLNKFSGIFPLSPVHPLKHPEKLPTFVLCSNNFSGIFPVNPEQS